MGAGVAEAQVVGLALGVAPVLEEEELQPHPRQLAVLLQLRHQDRAEPQAELRQLRARDLRDRVLGGDVADLVAHHAREVGFAF